jgi:hypothetical protein
VADLCVDDEGRYKGVVTQPAVTGALGETYRREDRALEAAS